MMYVGHNNDIRWTMQSQMYEKTTIYWRNNGSLSYENI